MKIKRVLAIVLVLAMALALMPVAALAADDDYVIWTGSQTKTAGSIWWDWLVWTQVDGTKLTEGGTLVIRHDTPWLGLNVVLKGPSNSWAQVWTNNTSAVDGAYETVVSYADMVATYGTADLSDVAEIDVYMSMSEGTTVTATEIRYEYPGSGDEGGEEEEPAATYVVAGDAALCGSAWNSGDSNNLMTDEDGDGVYTKVYENVAAGWPNFKVVEILPDGTQNWLTDQEDPTWSMWLETKEGDTVTITYEPATGVFTYTAETPSASATYVVAGTADLCGTEWDASNTDNLMTDEDGDGVYTKVYENLTEGWPNFKVVEILSDGTQNWLTDAANGTDNMWVEAKDGDTLTITYEPATGTITYTIEGVAPPTYVVAGTADLCGTEWDATDENNLMTDEDGDGVYTKIYRNVKEGWPNFKVVEVQARGTQTWLTDAENGTDNMWLETRAGDTVVITYEPSTGEITYNRYRIYENAYLCCADDGWWPLVNMETDYKVSTTVTGSGTYTLSWNLNEWGWDPVSGLAVLYIDIENYDMIQMYDVANVVVTADGQEVPVTDYNVKVYESDGCYRIELYNMYSGTEGAVAGNLAFASNVTVTFDLVYTASYGDETNLVLIGSLLLVSVLGIVALVVTRKKLA